MSTIYDNFEGEVNLEVFKKDNPDPKTGIRRHYLSLVGLLQYVDILNGDLTGKELPEGVTEKTVKGMVAHCIGDLETREAAINPPTPPEPILYAIVWDFIHNEQSWNDAYNRESSPLKKYYEDHPEEDLWNTKENRAVKFNDRWYDGIFEGKTISCGTVWATDNSQKITLNGMDYYCEIWSDGLDPKIVNLYTDAALTESADKTFEITEVSFSPDCVHCWNGTINAPGAKLPWAVVDTRYPNDLSQTKGKIEFQYNGENLYPWGDEFRNFNKGYGVASLPTELGIEQIDPANQAGTDNFDPSTLVINGYVMEEVAPAPEPVEYDMTWDFIHDEQSWNDAYNREGSPLKKYYEDHPEEDLWNNTQHRAVNFNDRWYEGTINGEEVSCGTAWAADGVQKITVDGVDYYTPIWGYGTEGHNAELFSDIECKESTGKIFEIATVSFSPECVHCWDGTINAPGSKLPWAVIDTAVPHDLSVEKAKVELAIGTKKRYPYGEDFRNFNKGYGVISLPGTFNGMVQRIDPANQKATDTFDRSTLVVKGYVEPTE